MLVRVIVPVLIVAALTAGWALSRQTTNVNETDNGGGSAQTDESTGSQTSESDEQLHPMAIESLRAQDFSGGDFTIEETLTNGPNYQRFIASYQSDGLKIFGLLTVPTTAMPAGGFPAIVFMHGYVPPDEYTTLGSYSTYPLFLSQAGFVMFKPDLRGHGDSEGEPANAHFSEEYLVDTLNAVAYTKQHPKVNPSKIGYWGHSNGGGLGLKSLVVNSDIKAASLWAGVVGSYQSMIEVHVDEMFYIKDRLGHPLIVENGLPSENPDFWNQIDPYNFLDDITASVQLQHSVDDDGGTPAELSQELERELKKAGKSVEYFEYVGDDHNLEQNAELAFQRAINFYNRNL